MTETKGSSGAPLSIGLSAEESDRTRILPPGAAGGRLDLAGLRTALAPRYRVEAELGAGGMGQVFVAFDEVLERRVALKTILPAGARDPQWLARFHLEAALAAGLRHPNLVQVHEILQIGPTPVLVMELVEGVDLGQAVRAGVLSPEEVPRILAEVCDGIAYAHAHGVIHRDIKPSNILLDPDGTPKVTDFGLALRTPGPAMGRSPASLDEGGVVGSPAYMAPEQTTGKAADLGTRTDIYALGATLYFCLTAQPPATGRTVDEIVDRVRNEDPVPPRRLNPRVTRDIEAICLRALSKVPDARYPSARELARDLRHALAGLPVTARRYGPREVLTRALAAHKEALTLGLGAVLLMAVGLYATITLMHGRAETLVLDELRRKLTDLASTAVLLVDSDLVQAVQGPNMAALPQARVLAARLAAIDAQAPDIRYVWIMRRHADGGASMEIVASSESFLPPEQAEVGDIPALPGDRFDAGPFPELLQGFHGPTADRSPDITDQWGVALSGYAPVRDASGNAIAVLGVDVTQRDLLDELERLHIARRLAILIAGALAALSAVFILATLVGRWRRSALE